MLLKKWKSELQNSSKLFPTLTLICASVGFVFYIYGYYTIHWARFDFKSQKGYVEFGVWFMCETLTGNESWKYCVRFPNNETSGIAAPYTAFQVLSTINIFVLLTAAAISEIYFLQSVKLKDKSKMTATLLATFCFIGGLMTTITFLIFVSSIREYYNDRGDIYKNFKLCSSFITVFISAVIESFAFMFMAFEFLVVNFRKDPYAAYADYLDSQLGAR